MFKKYPLVSIPVRNGLLGGILGSALLVSLFFLGRHPFLIPVWIDFRLIMFIVLLVFTLNEYRNAYRQGSLSFWEGMIMSLLFTLSFALCASALLWIFGAIDQHFVEKYIELKTEQLRLYPAAEIEKIGKPTYEYYVKALPATTAFDLASLYFLQSFGLSFFISIIISLILRRQPKL